MRRMREIGRKRRKTGRRWIAIVLALGFLLTGGGAQGRVNAAPAAESAALISDGEMAAGAASAAESAASFAGTPVFAAGIPMQAAVPVHVRTGPGVQWPSIGVLAQGQVVSVLASDPSGWQMIDYGGESGYVNGAYLAAVPAASGEAQAGMLPQAGQNIPGEGTLPQAGQNISGEGTLPQAGQNISGEGMLPQAGQIIPGAVMVFIGDSRFVQMEEAVGENPYVWIAESGKGLDWFEEKGVQRADAVIGTGTRVLINLGVNDVRNIDRYITFFNQKAAEWTLRGAVVYYASVNPVWTNPYVTKEQVEAFNQKLQANLAPYVIWIDSYSWMQAAGMRIVDGLHYDEATYRNLYALYLMTCMNGAVPAQVQEGGV